MLRAQLNARRLGEQWDGGQRRQVAGSPQQPWYFGKAQIHIPNNTDRTVAPQGGHMVQREGCFDISADDPDIARIREIERSQGR